MESTKRESDTCKDTARQLVWLCDMGSSVMPSRVPCLLSLAPRPGSPYVYGCVYLSVSVSLSMRETCLYMVLTLCPSILLTLSPKS